MATTTQGCKAKAGVRTVNDCWRLWLQEVAQSNEQYVRHMEQRLGNERYVEGTTQTPSSFFKDKEVQHSRPTCDDGMAQATPWTLAQASHEDRRKDTRAQCGPLAQGARSTDTRSACNAESEDQPRDGESGAWDDLGSPERTIPLLDALRVAERAVAQNGFHDQLLVYRDFRLQPEAQSDGQQRLVHLWSFRCHLTEGRNVSCMAWNPVKQDLLAVGYGSFDFKLQCGGMIAFWSLKNQFYPEWYISARSGVTAVDFSSSHGRMRSHGPLRSALNFGTVVVPQET
eukprot:scaffold1637_cov410-Prasinococcus_capsulatus_cf.AAC.33